MNNFQGVIRPVVNLGVLQVRAWFGIDQILALKVLLGTTHVEKYTINIFPTERKIVIEHLPPGAVRRRRTVSNMTKILSREGPVNKQNEMQRLEQRRRLLFRPKRNHY